MGDLLQICAINIVVRLLLFLFLPAPRPELVLDAHDGPITAIERSPFFKDVILTAGGWSFAIWKEKLTVSLIKAFTCSFIRVHRNTDVQDYYN